MEALTELPTEHWPLLQEKLLRNWPQNIAGYYALKKNLEYPKMREAFQFKVYCPYGNIEDGFVATTVRGHMTTLILSPVNEDTSKLVEALSTSKAIDWTSEFVAITEVPSQAIEVINSLKPVIGLRYAMEGAAILFHMDRTKSIFEDIKLPDYTYVAQVKQKDIKRVSETWFREVPTASSFFSNLASMGFSYGLYSQSNKLLAWVFTSEHNVLQHLYCEEESRGKRYGEYILKYAVNDQLKQGNDIYCFADDDNCRVLNLLIKVGFQPVDHFYYCDCRSSK